MTKYSKSAVNKEIAKDSRIGRREARLIHALLKGRQVEDEPTAPTTYPAFNSRGEQVDVTIPKKD